VNARGTGKTGHLPNSPTRVFRGDRGSGEERVPRLHKDLRQTDALLIPL